jgi:hypothetical protein
MSRIKRGLKKAWRERIRTVSPSVHRETYWLGDGWRAFARIGMMRFLAWCAMMPPFPQSWHIAAIFATVVAFLGAVHLTQRGQAEGLLSLYGGGDRDLLGPTRHWHWRRLLWGAADAAVVLGAWGLMDRIPWWAVALGIPTYAAACVISPRVLVAVVPETLLLWLARSAVVFAILLAVAIGQVKGLKSWSEPVFWVLGLASPSGWVVLMLHGLLAGKVLLWGVVPLLIAAGFAARSFARTQDRSLLEWANGAGWEAMRELPTGGIDPDEADFGIPAQEDVVPGSSLSGTPDVGGALKGFRNLGLPDIPLGKKPMHPPPWKKAAWTAGILLVLAVLARPEFVALGTLRLLALGVGIIIAYVLWLPVLGVPAWLWYAPISRNRFSSLCGLFPVSFRSVVGSLMRQDARVAARVLPGLTGLTFLVFQIAFSPPVWVALGGAGIVGVAALLLLPLRWFRLTIWPLAHKPFRPARIGHGALITLMAVLFLLEAVMLVIAAFLAFGEVSYSPDRYWMAVFVPILGSVNALAAMAGVWFGLRAYERVRYDLVKLPPKS